MSLIGLGLIVSVAIILGGKLFPNAPYTVNETKEIAEPLGIASAIAWLFGSIMAVSTYYYGGARGASLAFLGAILNAMGALMTAGAVIIDARAW